MTVICEMIITEIFNLSGGYVVLVGKAIPDIDRFIPESMADLYVDNKKIRTIHLVGEDRFSGIKEEKRKDRRAVRTKDDIITDVSIKNKEIKLVIFDQ